MTPLLDALLPQRCAACAEPAPTGLCRPCLDVAGDYLLADRGFAELADGVVAVGAFAYAGVIGDAVRGVKVAGRFAAAVPLGDVLRHCLNLPDWTVTWVPSSRRRLRERGVEIPRMLAGRAAVRLLSRPRHGPDQTSLDAAARRRSPLGAFAATAPAPRRVVLVDDVRTTGATALAAAGALRGAGARQVLVATFAVGGDSARRSAGTGAG